MRSALCNSEVASREQSLAEPCPDASRGLCAAPDLTLSPTSRLLCTARDPWGWNLAGIQRVESQPMRPNEIRDVARDTIRDVPV